MRNYGLKDLIRSVTNKSDNYDEKYVKIKFNSDDDLHLKKTVELYHTAIVARPFIYKDNKYYQKVFWQNCCNIIALVLAKPLVSACMLFVITGTFLR